MKYILWTDPHLGIYNNNQDWLDITYNFHKYLTDFAKEKNIKNLICLGDFFDNRKELSVKTINYAYDIIELLNNFSTYIIIGNHDTFFKKSLLPTSLRLFNNYENISIIEKPININEKISLVPWGLKFQNCKTPILMGHFEIKGMPLNDNINFYSEGYTIKNFKKYEKVFSGHFHTPSQKENIIYLGSPYPQTFNDVNSSRGFYVFDDSTYDLEFIEYKNSPKFVHIKSNEEFKEDQIKDNCIKLIYTEELSLQKNTELIDLINSYSPKSLVTDFSLIKWEDDIIQDELFNENNSIKSNSELLFDFIDKKEIPEYINKNILKKFIKKLEVN